MSTLASAGVAVLISSALTIAPVPPDLPSVDSAARSASVQPLDLNVLALDLDASIEPPSSEVAAGGETTITLKSDVLFDFASAELPDGAERVIAEAVADIPDGASVGVDGHTDSIGDADANQTLSEDRAQAVADVVAEERPDLELEVAGHGEDDPVEANTTGGEDNPEGRAKNRRVEITHQD